MQGSPDLSFPKVRRVELKSFTLYSKQPDLQLNIPPGVFCLAGANGLGKSTFLASLNFGLTGIVPDPERELRSHSRVEGGYIDDYFRHHRTVSGYTESFFTGRISGADREEASVAVEFEIGGKRFRLCRGVFDGAGLREFEVRLGDEVIFAGASETMLELEDEYQSQLTTAVGVGSFEQFVFLQHFVFTFDESRQLLLWNHRTLNHALHLCIGSDFDRANKADTLQRQMERAGSLARNKQYQASGVSSRIKALLDAVGGDQEADETCPTPEEVFQAHRAIGEKVDAQQHKVEKKLGQLRDTELKWAEASSELSAYQSEFSREFSLHVHNKSRVELHPLVVATFSEDECAICGTAGVAQTVRMTVRNGDCPLCGSGLAQAPSDEDALARLKAIDRLVGKSRESLEQVTADKERITAEVLAAESRLTALRREYREFEEAHRQILLLAISESGGQIRETISRLESELTDLLEQKEAKYNERDKLKRQLVKLQRKLEREYELAEDEFVPLFQRLAYSFLGIELFVRAESNEGVTSIGLSLLLEMRGSIRREVHQLSESQRFFLDIALRMAMAQYMSKQSNEATLYIDTPEGSLDIAYEARAGSMFAAFIELGHDIVMTANINSSQILRRLAQLCGRERMSLQQMTSWAELSDVQLRDCHKISVVL